MSTHTTQHDLPTQLTNLGVRLRHPTHTGGAPLASTYVEDYWLPVLGPTSIAIIRYFARHLTPTNTFHNYDPPTLAAGFGLGHATSRNSPLYRTLHRLHQFSVAQLTATDTAGEAHLTLPTHLLQVPHHLRRNWSPELHTTHATLTGQDPS